MSHVAEVKIRVRNLDTLAAAAEECGCELVRDAQTYRWYGRSMGDYRLPDGFTAEELGKCAHVIRVKGAGAHTYEVGVVLAKDGDGFTLLYDNWQRGYGLEDKIGAGASKLKAAYAAQRATQIAKLQGYRVERSVNAAGQIVLTATR